MARTVKEIVEAFELLFAAFHDKAFCKTMLFSQYNETELLPLVRTFLLGWFGHEMTPEKQSALPSCLSGKGSIDFVVGGVAVEFAVRAPGYQKAALAHYKNADEVRKLVKHRGLGLLVLFDFSKTPFNREELERYRQWPSLGKGNRRSAFNVAYFYRTPNRKNGLHQLNIKPAVHRERAISRRRRL